MASLYLFSCPKKRFVDETEILSFITILFPQTIFTIFYNFKTKEEGSHGSASLRVAKERGPPPSEEHRTPTRRFTIGRMGWVWEGEFGWGRRENKVSK